MIHTRKDRPHFTKLFGNGAESDRVVLPGVDGCLVKATLFKAQAGFKADDIVYNNDETGHVIGGQFIVTYADGKVAKLNDGDTFHVPAGTEYAIECVVGGSIFCVFSVAANGKPVEDEEIPVV